MEVKQVMIASKRKTQNGFTIIEVMIAMVISSVLITAVYQTFHSQKRSYAIQSEAAAMEQNLRGSLYLLTKELSAGYNPKHETNDNFRFVTSFPARIIGKYLSRLRKLHQVIAPKEGFEAQLRAARVPITFGMSALGMTRQIHDGRLYRVIEPGHVPGLQSLDNPA